VEKEIEDNPALEVAEDASFPDTFRPGYYLPLRTSSSDDASSYDFSPADSEESLYESLKRQLSERNLPEKVRQAAEYIIGNLDPNGYLRRPLQAVVNDMAFGPGIEIDLNDAEEGLKVVQELEPYGMGAADLRESLLIQLRHLPETPLRNDAIRILEEQFDELAMKHTHRIVSALKMTTERVQAAISLISSLNPKPGAALSSEPFTNNIIIPDLIINNEDGRLSLSTGNRIPELAIERTFSEAMAELDKKGKKADKKGAEFITTRYNDARDFIRILRQRQDTLLNVMGAIMKIQKEYFQTQDVYRLKPMMIKDIAALTGYDISVVSRATANKFVSTPWGIFPLRFFFSDSIGEESDDGTAILTNRKIEAEISSLVEKEDKKHPLSDEKIRIEMEKRGYDVSRRTVAKYRDRLGIPVARLRKDI
ncbi:MAG: RNA polymerase factor sigma-54, partial [Muribaculaceae bacterium]|nr:RNA polymerase factor sigma-54 [Muribaculaceae bacterium]